MGKQTKLACLQVKGVLSHTTKLGLLGPVANLAKAQCNFVEELWTGAEALNVPITNWTVEPIVVAKDQMVGEIEEVSLVDKDDAIWEDKPELVARVINQGADDHHAERKGRLQQQVVVGKGCSLEERSILLQTLLDKHKVFALSDQEFGETNLVEHHM